tara:strand:- start:2714 stop:3034 length:321 start_codon:yes stop_codon:yes gene_type:complete
MNYKKIFKTYPEKSDFETIIKDCFMIDNKKYILYDEIYKKNIKTINNYILSLKDKYHISKQSYLENLDFKKCITTIKQIAKIYDISIDTRRIYFNNSYKIYYIFSL